jgi:hypothetical protein
MRVGNVNISIRSYNELVTRSKSKSVVTRQCIVSHGAQQIEIDKMICDSGADMDNYIGRSIVEKMLYSVTGCEDRIIDSLIEATGLIMSYVLMT